MRISAATPSPPPVPLERAAVPASGAPTRAPEQTPPQPNPSMHLDPALNMVILEFRDAGGKVTNTLPTARALEQFRLNMTPAQQAAPSPAAQSASPPGADPPETADLLA